MFGSFMLAYRIGKGYTQRYMAFKIRVNYKQYGFYELGKIEPSMKIMRRIAKITSSSIYELEQMLDKPHATWHYSRAKKRRAK